MTDKQVHLRSPEQVHWIRIQYDPDFDHFLTDGAYSFTRGEINVDGYEANKKLQMFLEAFFHEVEVIRRKKRLNENPPSL